MNKRRSSRAMLLNPYDQMLWLSVAGDIGRGGITPFWSVPGGGLEEGESFEAALRREMREELGLQTLASGLHVATFEGLTQWGGRWYDNDSRFYVLRVDQAEFSSAGHTQLERDTVRGYRWWGYEEIRASSELFLPKAIVDVLGEVVGGSWDGVVRTIGPEPHTLPSG
ncbi:MAG: NUDIX domain-containing protein [Meiothermus sp.]|nr:NUDIX domain-containing protein [Meiothermus sp.]